MKLPRNTAAHGGDFPFCPWCQEPPYGLALPMDAVLAHIQRGLNRTVERNDDGSNDADIVCDCPSCAKPFAVALKSDGVVLLAVRTAADIRMMEGRP